MRLAGVTDKNTHPWHEFHENGELPLFQVPEAAVILNDALVTQVLQKLDLTLQSIHFLRRRRQGKALTSLNFRDDERSESWNVGLVLLPTLLVS